MKQVGKGRGRQTVRHPWKPLYWAPVLTIGLCLLVAKSILWGKLSESSVSYAPKVIGAIISLWVSYRGARIASRKNFLWGLVNGVAYGCILMLGNLLFFGETFSGTKEMFSWILIAAAVGSFVANIIRSKNA